MNPFQLLVKPVSFNCNLRCTYCFYLRVKELYPDAERPKMSERILETLISQFMGYQFKESIIGWQGGEPTLAGLDFFKKIVHFQQIYGKPGQVIGNALQTNGILIDDDWCQFLSKYKFLVGLSLDGPKSVHDKYRKNVGGKSVWGKVMNAALLMRNHQVEFNILCVVSKANINRVKELFNFFVDNSFYYLQFIPALEVDENGKKASFSINSSQYGKFLCDLFDLWIDDPHQVSIRLFNSILATTLGQPKGFCVLEQKCADYLLVEWNGDVYPCDFFAKESYKLGNVLQKDLAKLLEKRNNSFGKLKGELAPDCTSCKWLTYCYGGCIKDRIFPDNPHPNKTYYCEGLKAFFDYSHNWFLNKAKEYSQLYDV
jgi:uncharacterized protein